MLPFYYVVVSLLEMIAAEERSALSFMVLCFCLSDVAIKHGREAGELQCPETKRPVNFTVCSLHVQLQAPPQRPAREPPTEGKRRYACRCSQS